MVACVDAPYNHIHQEPSDKSRTVNKFYLFWSKLVKDAKTWIIFGKYVGFFSGLKTPTACIWQNSAWSWPPLVNILSPAFTIISTYWKINPDYFYVNVINGQCFQWKQDPKTRAWNKDRPHLSYCITCFVSQIYL